MPNWTTLAGVGAVTATLTAGLLATGPSSAQAASGPTAINAKNFSITSNYTKYNAPVAGLLKQAGAVSIDSVMKNVNHHRTPSTAINGQAAGFTWDSGDNNDTLAVPQGITTSRDAVGEADGGRYKGHQLIAASFFDNDHVYKDAKGNEVGQGSRINLTDWDSKFADTYTRILLVEPTGSQANPSFRDVHVHAGGIAWYGNYLYVADTNHGMRVFDMSKIIKTFSGGDAKSIGKYGSKFYAHHYGYALPQVGTITSHVAKGTTALTWSTISLDRPKKSIVMTEYKCPTKCDYAWGTSRAVRFNFATNSTAFPAATSASQALTLPYHNLNGVASHNGRWWFNDSTRHNLYYWTPGKSAKSHAWVSSGEAISYWEDSKGADLLWSLQEHHGNRNVFAVKQASYS